VNSAGAELAVAIGHHAAGRLDEAAQIYQRLHAANRRDSEVLYLQGVLCCDLGLFEQARLFLEEALVHAPAFPEARLQLAVAQSSLGGIALQQGDAAAAESQLVASLAHRPRHAQTLNWLGLARVQLANYASAEEPLRQALELEPDLNQARNNLGLALYRGGRLGDALACFEEALARDPAYKSARINLASTLRTLGRYSRAQRELETVVEAHPDAVDALTNLGAVFQDQGQSERALASLTRALILAPDSPTTRWNLALTQLLLGDFARGWANFEARWEGCEHLRGGYRMPPERAWRGEPLQGRRLLLWAEQGLGDTLQFIRFARDAAGQGAIVSLLAQPELVDLVRSAPGLTRVEPLGAPLPPYDLHCPLMSLPHRLSLTHPGQFHGAGAYLRADADRTLHWRRRLGAHPGIKVGLVWAGNSRNHIPELRAIDARRSIPLDLWGPIVAVPGCSFFNLKKGVSPAESAALAQAGIHDYSAQWRDFSDTAAMVVNLDLVVSVDTAVAHLAGALGKPVWLLNRYDTCWRWRASGCDSPWYGTMRQFRQHRPGDWEAAIAAVAAALAGTAALPAPARTAATPADSRARNAGFGVECSPPAQGRSSVENRRSQEPQGGLREFGLPEGSG